MNILVPWRKSVIESDPDLDDDDMVIVYLNCYPVHMGEDFQFYILDTYPYIILCFQQNVMFSCLCLCEPN